MNTAPTGRRRAAVVLGVVGFVLLGWTTPADAHGVGARSDLPVPLWLCTTAATVALVVSFLALGATWTEPRFSRWAGGGTPVPKWADRGARLAAPVAGVAGLLIWVLTLTAGWFGNESPAFNIAPAMTYIAFWVGMQVVASVVGDVWSHGLSPFRWATSVRKGDLAAGPHTAREWAAPALFALFAWLELCYFDSSNPRVVALWLSLHSLVALGGAIRWGPSWLQRCEPFTVLFVLLAALAPFGRGEDGRLRLRVPLSGLSRVDVGPAQAALVLVVLGSTTFDGFSRSSVWQPLVENRTGWALTAWNTLGLLAVVAVVIAAYLVGAAAISRIGERPLGEVVVDFVGPLVPIVLGYSLAHYFSLLVFEGQSLIALASDPLGRGWNLFGTADRRIDYLLVSTGQIAWVQVASIVGGHVAGVVAAHDRALERWPARTAARTQQVMLIVMVAYTVCGLALLLGG